MIYLARPVRDGVLDNLWGAMACLVVAALVYIPNSGYPAACSARAGKTVYLWYCAFPAMTIAALLFLAITIPLLRLLYAWLGFKSCMGIIPVSLSAGFLYALLPLAVAPEAIPQTFFAGVVGGLVFTLARDFVGTILKQPEPPG